MISYLSVSLESEQLNIKYNYEVEAKTPTISKGSVNFSKVLSTLRYENISV